MPDESSQGLWAAIGSGCISGAAVLISLLGRRPAADSSARAVSLDRTQQAIIDGLRQELRDARAQCAAERDDARLWERRARRVDEIAHTLWHVVAPLIMNGVVKNDLGFTRIPLLEDPL